MATWTGRSTSLSNWQGRLTLDSHQCLTISCTVAVLLIKSHSCCQQLDEVKQQSTNPSLLLLLLCFTLTKSKDLVATRWLRHSHIMSRFMDALKGTMHRRGPMQRKTLFCHFSKRRLSGLLTFLYRYETFCTRYDALGIKVDFMGVSWLQIAEQQSWSNPIDIASSPMKRSKNNQWHSIVSTDSFH